MASNRGGRSWLLCWALLALVVSSPASQEALNRELTDDELLDELETIFDEQERNSALLRTQLTEVHHELDELKTESTRELNALRTDLTRARNSLTIATAAQHEVEKSLQNYVDGIMTDHLITGTKTGVIIATLTMTTAAISNQNTGVVIASGIIPTAIGSVIGWLRGKQIEAQYDQN